jgi:hypothetical protein
MAVTGAARWVLVAVMGVMLVLGSARLVWVRRADRHLDVAEVLMGAGGLGMLVPGLSPASTGCWEGLFAADAAWLLAARIQHTVHLRRRAHVVSRRRAWEHYAHQVAANLAMLVMLTGSVPSGMGMPAVSMAAMAAAPGAGAMSAADGGAPVLSIPGALAVYFIADAARSAARLFAGRGGCSDPAPQRHRVGTVLAAPVLTVGRHVAMALGMAAMLLPIR